jgi:tetratricopeptide (TPR) repeat protein
MPENRGKLTRFWQELKRRRVFSVVTAYAATAYIIIEVTNNVVSPLHLPAWIPTVVILVLIAGLPVAVILSWIFDFTPQGIRRTESIEESESKEILTKPSKRRLRPSYVLNAILIVAVIILAYREIFRQDPVERLRSSSEKISVAVMPFQNLTNDTTWNVWQDGIQQSLISSLSNTEELFVRQKESVNSLLQTRGLKENASISPSFAGLISSKLDADIFIYGSIQQAGSKIRLEAQLIDTKTKEVIKSIETNGSYKVDIIFDITDSLRKKIIDFLLISKLIKENPGFGRFPLTTRSPEALRFFIYGENARGKGDFSSAINWELKALTADSDFADAAFSIENSYSMEGNSEQSKQWLIKNYEKRDKMPFDCQLYASWAYAFSFESPAEQIKYLNQLLEIDDKVPTYLALLGLTYNDIKQYDKAIPELEKSLAISRKWGKDYMKDPGIYWELGNSYNKTGQYKKEKKLYKEAEQYLPDNQGIITRQALLAFAEKDSVAANQYIEKLKSVCKEKYYSSEVDIIAQVGWIYSEVGIPNKAEEYYRKALLLDPINPGLMDQFANFLINNNRNLIEVSELMDKAMKLTADKVDYYNYMNTKGWALYKQGKNQEALAILQKAWDETPFKVYFIKSHLEEVKKAIAEQKNN